MACTSRCIGMHRTGLALKQASCAVLKSTHRLFSACRKHKTLHLAHEKQHACWLKFWVNCVAGCCMPEPMLWASTGTAWRPLPAVTQ